MGYLNEFLRLKCSTDVMRAIWPVNNPAKEITESMAIIKQLRKILRDKDPSKFILEDLCAGNSLTSAIAAHLYPFKWVFAYDIRKRERNWVCINRFTYSNFDIFKPKTSEFEQDIFEEDTILISVHACAHLAERVIDIYNESEKAKHLIMMPCCRGKMEKNAIPNIIQDKIGNYLSWCYWLMLKCTGKRNLIRDEKCKSPCNAIIIASKE